jgi:tRNA uridine 5-carboxymethylaminomethyl modification enzyme
MGVRTALVTFSRDGVACMPCNPSVGGIAKSHLVYELDALGGEMGRNTDYTGIQFRTLNTRKGPAVQSTRAQCDKTRYARRMLAVILRQPNLHLVEAEVTGLLIRKGQVVGVATASGEILAQCVVVTAGTFLRGTIHVGKKSWPGGRLDAPSSTALADSLREAGFQVGRLKTGTPPRLHRDSINYAGMEPQPGEEPPPFFSWEVRRMFHVEQDGGSAGQQTGMFHVEHLDEDPAISLGAGGTTPSRTRNRTLQMHLGGPGTPPVAFAGECAGPSDLAPWRPGSDQLPCFLTHTNQKTHSIIHDNLGESALYGGMITGTGARYCPSVEDKVVKFAAKEAHHVFLEPEGRDSDLIYPNGISNSLPASVQDEVVHSIHGLEQAKIIRYGYAIEYDFCDPTQLFHSLEAKNIRNLYLAGQINGTTGYEEAAAQGLMAGVNAAMAVLGRVPVILSRVDAYIGVLIDDLVTKGTDEPYRMFTSRAERRLILRQDNARYRLHDAAGEIGIVDKEFLRETALYSRTVQTELARLRSVHKEGSSLLQILARPEMTYDALPEARDLPTEVVEQVQIQAKYAGYIEAEERAAARVKAMESLTIPADFDYWSVKTLRYESREKLSRIRPDSLGQAARISGINPADLAILSVLLHKPTH